MPHVSRFFTERPPKPTRYSINAGPHHTGKAFCIDQAIYFRWSIGKLCEYSQREFSVWQPTFICPV